MDAQKQAPEFIIKAPFMDELIDEIRNMHAEIEAIKARTNPQKELYTLQEACSLKGISEGTLSNRAYAYLKPNCGKPDLVCCNRPRWKWQTVQKWLHQSDDELLELSKTNKERK